MNLRDEILKEHSRDQAKKITEWIGDNQSRFDELVTLFLNDKYRVVQRAGWPLSNAVIEHPWLVRKHLGKLVKNLRTPGLHDAVKRNTLRFLIQLDIPGKYEGELMDLCFGYVASMDEAVAVKAHSLAILQKLAGSYPEILPEIRLVIEERWEHETAAFRSRARKILQMQEK